MTSTKNANLRVCASCEFIYREPGESEVCPMCSYGATFGARSVYGDKCYKYEETQEPFKCKIRTAMEETMDAYILNARSLLARRIKS